MKIRRVALISLLLAMAICLNIIEGFIPMLLPGFKLGLANLIILIMLYEFKSYEALLVNILRILIVGLLRGSFLEPQWFMSLSGGLLSFLIMWLFSRIKFFSPIGVSVLGAVFHSTGQVLVAMVLLDTTLVIYYLPFIAIMSIGTGILNGILTKVILKRKIVSSFLNTYDGKEEDL